MTPFDNVKKCVTTNAHGEVNFFQITDGFVDLSNFTDTIPERDGFIVGHSESGHHHVLEREGVKMKECVSEGMKILYAILENPVTLKQSAGSPHKTQIVPAGEYLITNNRDYDPFLQQVRRVAD